ncbi:hypothetical protein P153DRAFT_387066 [Dothidotthia symphoricarpi CBS 119687]|uniref:Uncharacterized protein n=1 Tax=Dothidotthia symphoricarpi CBS 119687 TaxID=1392245 RepID=A0A6A6AA64_9PLEO|nr:uncharacterized protein P153DRAFT_387066 [Dothidotthia symphoricarpi CBS 119687]KAF2128103.1 hypothetical protein P153DRAFT_387066 [Dothidotthia symphoricarpi CBS 119687]
MVQAMRDGSQGRADGVDGVDGKGREKRGASWTQSQPPLGPLGLRTSLIRRASFGLMAGKGVVLEVKPTSSRPREAQTGILHLNFLTSDFSPATARRAFAFLSGGPRLSRRARHTRVDVPVGEGPCGSHSVWLVVAFQRSCRFLLPCPASSLHPIRGPPISSHGNLMLCHTSLQSLHAFVSRCIHHCASNAAMFGETRNVHKRSRPRSRRLCPLHTVSSLEEAPSHQVSEAEHLE